MPFDQISSARMVREDLDAVWEWVDYRRGLYKDCQPNAAHFALAEWQNRFEDFTLITQNVDGLHERAGSKIFSNSTATSITPNAKIARNL